MRGHLGHPFFDISLFLTCSLHLPTNAIKGNENCKCAKAGSETSVSCLIYQTAFRGTSVRTLWSPFIRFYPLVQFLPPTLAFHLCPSARRLPYVGAKENTVHMTEQNTPILSHRLGHLSPAVHSPYMSHIRMTRKTHILCLLHQGRSDQAIY